MANCRLFFARQVSRLPCQETRLVSSVGSSNSSGVGVPPASLIEGVRGPASILFHVFFSTSRPSGAVLALCALCFNARSGASSPCLPSFARPSFVATSPDDERVLACDATHFTTLAITTCTFEHAAAASLWRPAPGDTSFPLSFRRTCLPGQTRRVDERVTREGKRPVAISLICRGLCSGYNARREPPLRPATRTPYVCCACSSPSLSRAPRELPVSSFSFTNF